MLDTMNFSTNGCKLLDLFNFNCNLLMERDRRIVA